MNTKKTNSKIYIYLRGFLKGTIYAFLYLILYYSFILISLALMGYNMDFIEKVFSLRGNWYNLIAWLFGIVIVYYVVRRHRLSHAWMLLALFVSVYTLPFIMGLIELEKYKKLPKNRKRK